MAALYRPKPFERVEVLWEDAVMNRQLKQAACLWIHAAHEPETMGTMTSARERIFLAAFTSAWSA